MRLRNIKGSREYIAASPYVIQDFTEHKGRWQEVFGNRNPLHIEVGMGKGQFLTELAGKNPQVNYIGIEKFSSVLLRAIQKQEELELPNLRFIRMDAECIGSVFGRDEISRIYLNFSDPWPKDRHRRRRLTSREFLERYGGFLQKDGQLEFKTDNVALFDFSLEEAEASGWETEAFTYDLHRDGKLNQGNIQTEYEERFSAMGNPICKLILHPPQKEKE
jgi:tRNA (guanine-N7-)-methyltransferase